MEKFVRIDGWMFIFFVKTTKLNSEYQWNLKYAGKTAGRS